LCRVESGRKLRGWPGWLGWPAGVVKYVKKYWYYFTIHTEIIYSGGRSPGIPFNATNRKPIQQVAFQYNRKVKKKEVFSKRRKRIFKKIGKKERKYMLIVGQKKRKYTPNNVQNVKNVERPAGNRN
jgi:hypothetical protein